MDHSFDSQVLLAYSPVIDRQRNVIATRLTVWPTQPSLAVDAQAVLDSLSATWPPGGAGLWLNVASESLLQGLMAKQPSDNIVLEVPAFMAVDEANTAALVDLHANGSTLVLKGRPLQALPPLVLPCFKYALVDQSDERRGDAPANTVHLSAGSGNTRSVACVQAGVESLNDMESAFRRGVIAVLGWPIDDVIQESAKPADQPALQVIVQLIDQVHRGEEIDVLERTLKHDPPLAYKLMRYINSPAFGLSVEISSFRHAIMILGYQRLKRWLALLLATASKDPNMRPVMFAAVRRGLFLEELAKLGGDEDMRNELFICGVFSLLDRMFRQPFSALLKTIPVPTRVYEALSGGTGPFAPYFELVSAIEGCDPFAIRQASEALMLGHGDVNQALLAATLGANQLD